MPPVDAFRIALLGDVSGKVGAPGGRARTASGSSRIPPARVIPRAGGNPSGNPRPGAVGGSGRGLSGRVGEAPQAGTPRSGGVAAGGRDAWGWGRPRRSSGVDRPRVAGHLSSTWS